MNTPSKLTRITKRAFREEYPSYDLLGTVYGTAMDTLCITKKNIADGRNLEKSRRPSTGNYNTANQGKCVIITCYEVTIDGITLRMLETRVNHDLANRSNATGISYYTIVYIKKTQQERTQR